MELDEKDIQLLEILEQNAKSPVQELSSKTGIPASTVHHRIKKLEREKDYETFENHLPAGFHIGGSGNETFTDKDGDVWEVVDYNPYKLF